MSDLGPIFLMSVCLPILAVFVGYAFKLSKVKCALMAVATSAVYVVVTHTPGPDKVQTLDDFGYNLASDASLGLLIVFAIFGSGIALSGLKKLPERY